MQSGEFNAFMLRVLTTLNELINKLRSPEVLDSMLQHLAKQHAWPQARTLPRTLNACAFDTSGEVRTTRDGRRHNRHLWILCSLDPHLEET